jgi:AraC family transcriptional regulator
LSTKFTKDTEDKQFKKRDPISLRDLRGLPVESLCLEYLKALTPKMLYNFCGDAFLAKIAVELESALADRAATGAAACTTPRRIAEGRGWTVSDVICTSGPQDRSFEEQHTKFSIALVVAGTFQYRAQNRSGRRGELMTPGSLLLGNAGQHFECGHEHAAGDRCLAFQYTPEYFEELAGNFGLRSSISGFSALRMPPVRALSPLVAHACAGLNSSQEIDWEELSIRFAAATLQLASGHSPQLHEPSPSTLARVTRSVRLIDRHPHNQHSLESLAREARLSPYHFLRTFERLTGLPPHQYVRRIRLREAAVRLTTGRDKILDTALDCGFGDISNFTRAFRQEFGESPRRYRMRTAKSVHH